LAPGGTIMKSAHSHTNDIYIKNEKQEEQPAFLFHWPTFITFGTLLTGLGLFTVVFSSFSFIGLRSYLSFMIVSAGLLYLLLGGRTSDWEGRVASYISGLLYLLAGIYIVTNVEKPKELAYVLGPTVLVEGILLSVVSILLKLSKTWRWLLLSGFTSIAIAFILVSSPDLDFRFITNIFAINLITTGLAYNAYGFDLKRHFPKAL
jgi:uncharacterized membrane protein HdeD (DUF308 family)